MRSASIGTSGGALAARALTPLLDVLFLLLFALLALSDTRTAREAERVRVELPAVEPADRASPSPGRIVALEIDRDSRVRVAGGAPLATRAALDDALAAALGDGVPEEVAVDLLADRDARHGVVAEVLQQLRLRGFVRVRLAALGAEGGERELGEGARSGR